MERRQSSFWGVSHPYSLASGMRFDELYTLLKVVSCTAMSVCVYY